MRSTARAQRAKCVREQVVVAGKSGIARLVCNGLPVGLGLHDGAGHDDGLAFGTSGVARVSAPSPPDLGVQEGEVGALGNVGGGP